MFHVWTLSRAALVPVLLFVCGCAGVARGPAFDVPFPGETIAGLVLQRDTLNNILTIWEARFAPDCSDHEVIGTEMVREPTVDEQGRMLSGSWIERWTLDRCGAIVHYTVTYIADGQGGTFIGTEPEEMPEG